MAIFVALLKLIIVISFFLQGTLSQVLTENMIYSMID